MKLTVTTGMPAGIPVVVGVAVGVCGINIGAKGKIYDVDLNPKPNSGGVLGYLMALTPTTECLSGHKTLFNLLQLLAH